MIKFNIINKRIGVLLLSGVILCFNGCSKKEMDDNVNSSYTYDSIDSVLEDSKYEFGKVFISNVDKDTNNELAGTKLSILEEDGTIINSFVTTNEVQEIELKEGRYQLVVDKETNYYSSLDDNIWFNIENGKETKIILKNEIIESFNEASEIEISKVERTIDNSIEQVVGEDNDNKVIEYFENIDDKINNMVYNAKDEIIDDYEIVYDFIFNGGTIKGYTFNEVKDNTKSKAIDLYLKIDEKIESKYPNYKETIEEKFGDAKVKVKEKLSSVSSKLQDKIIDEIGIDKYEEIIDTKDKYIDKFKEQTASDISDLKELGETIKDKVKSYVKR